MSHPPISACTTGAAHIVKLLKSEGTRLSPGPGALVAALLCSELPPPSKVRMHPAWFPA